MRRGLSKIFHMFAKRKFWRAIFVVVAICFVALSPAVLFRQENFKLNLNQFLNLQGGNKVVLTLCHVETFEGGSASRAGFLKRQAEKFNKQNNNFFVTVTAMSMEEFELNICQGYAADIYSFGTGAGGNLLGKMKVLDEQEVIREDLQKNARVNGEIYAYPYMLSGYAAISYESLTSQDESLQGKLTASGQGKKTIGGVVLGGGMNNAAKALCCSKICLSEKDVTMKETSYAAYAEFLKKNTKSLVGTARDVARVKNREQNGGISPCTYQFLHGYSDLVQYVGINGNLDKARGEVATKFLSFLISPEAQCDIAKYGLFSVTGQKIYDGEYMGEFEQALSLPLEGVSAFANREEIEKNVQLAKDVLCGK